MLSGFAGHWSVFFFFFFKTFSCHLNTLLVIWVFEEVDSKGFIWLWCLFCGFICLFPRDWAFVSMGIRSITALCSRNEKETFFLSSLALPGFGCSKQPCLSGLMSQTRGHSNYNCTLILRQKNKWSCYLIYSDGPRNTAFHVWIWFPRTRSNDECFVRKITSTQNESSFFFFFLAVVTNSVRYKIKITYFVINILIY